MLHENIIVIRDRNVLGDVQQKLELSFAAPRVSLREIIAERVRKEVEACNEGDSLSHHGLTGPADAESAPDSQERHTVNVEQQIEIALKAFESNEFFVFVGDRQVETLDTQVELTPETKVTFIRLVPLVGG